MSREEAASGSDKQYYSVYDGSFRTRVREGTPEALERVNKKGVQVFEKEVKALFGYIEDVSIEDSDFGKQVKITLDKNDDGKNPVLTFGVESKDGRDVLRKLPSIDYSKEVRIMPYRFTPEDSDKEVSGISFTQQDEEGKYTVKIENHFFDNEKKEYLHGFPTIDWDSSSESEQKIYKIQRDDFLVRYAEEHVVPKVSLRKPADYGNPSGQTDNGFEYPEEEIDPKDIPF